MAEDGFRLLEAINQNPDLQGLKQVDVLRKVWTRSFEGQGEQIHLLDEPASPLAEAVVSPYDPEARYANKGSVKWNG